MVHVPTKAAEGQRNLAAEEDGQGTIINKQWRRKKFTTPIISISISITFNILGSFDGVKAAIVSLFVCIIK